MTRLRSTDDGTHPIELQVTHLFGLISRALLKDLKEFKNLRKLFVLHAAGTNTFVALQAKVHATILSRITFRARNGDLLPGTGKTISLQLMAAMKTTLEPWLFTSLGAEVRRPSTQLACFTGNAHKRFYSPNWS